MNISLFITLLTVFSVITGLVTEAIKNLLDDFNAKYSANIIALIVACVVGIGGTAGYYAVYEIPFETGNVICMILMGFASALSAMVGYDKVVQTVKQFITTE